jgi:hypothetical protein
MDSNRLPKLAVRCKPKGFRDTRRPFRRKIWSGTGVSLICGGQRKRRNSRLNSRGDCNRRFKSYIKGKDRFEVGTALYPVLERKKKKVKTPTSLQSGSCCM